jgi:hypothetical protein
VTYSVDVALVLDLPKDPSPMELANEIAQALTKRADSGTLDGCVSVVPLEDEE